jgi:hypothetical protein
MCVCLCGAADPVLQDVSGGLPVKVESPFGGDLPLYGMQIDLEQARAELRTAVAGGGTAGACKRLVSATVGVSKLHNSVSAAFVQGAQRRHITHHVGARYGCPSLLAFIRLHGSFLAFIRLGLGTLAGRSVAPQILIMCQSC